MQSPPAPGTGRRWCAAGAALGVGAVTLAMNPPGEPTAYRRLASAANARVHAIERPRSQPWSVQILADIQDGFLYVPEILRQGRDLDVDAVILAGDLARGNGGDHLALLTRQLERNPLRVPLFAVPGNHDTVRRVDRRNFEATFGASEFEFKIGHTTFVGLDSSQGPLPGELRRVRDAIERARPRGERVVVVRHHSPLPSPENPYSSDALASLLCDPVVAVVISGHAHRWEFQEREGVRFVVAPPSGDRSHGQGQTPISYLIVHWTGERYELEHRQMFRSNATELRSAIAHVVQGHLLPALYDAARVSASPPVRSSQADPPHPLVRP